MSKTLAILILSLVLAMASLTLSDDSDTSMGICKVGKVYYYCALKETLIFIYGTTGDLYWVLEVTKEGLKLIFETGLAPRDYLYETKK